MKITINRYDGHYIATGDCARRLSLFTGNPLLRVHQRSPRVLVEIPSRTLQGLIVELRQSGYRPQIISNGEGT